MIVNNNNKNYRKTHNDCCYRISPNSLNKYKYVVRSRCEKIVQIDVKAPNLAWLMFRSNYFIWATSKHLFYVFYRPDLVSGRENIFFFKIGLIIYHAKALLKFFKMKLRISMRKCTGNELLDFQILHNQGVCKRKTRIIQTFLDVYWLFEKLRKFEDFWWRHH